MRERFDGSDRRVGAYPLGMLVSERSTRIGETLERIAIWRAPSLPGVELKTIDNAAQLRCVFHESFALVSPVRGVSRRRFLGETIERAPGQLMFYEPGDFTTHTFLEAGSALHVLSIDPVTLQRALGPSARPPQTGRWFPLAMVSSNELASCVATLADAYAREAEQDVYAAFFELVRALRAAWTTDRSATEPAYALRVTLRVRDHLHADLRGERSIEALASELGVSPFYLSRAFKERFGTGPVAYRQALRAARARKLLRAGHLPSDVASLLGFSDFSHFRRTFFKYVGLSPSEYVKDSRRSR